MEQEFFINNGAILPVLRMELIIDGRYSFWKFHEAIQNAVVTFSMKNVDTDILKISKAPCEIVLADDGGCEEKYIIQYKWKPRDTKEPGKYKGWFNIEFLGDLSQYGVEYPSGLLIVPLSEDLYIYIK
jgi:hypothetical protein